jgi:hypothetical protein
LRWLFALGAFIPEFLDEFSASCEDGGEEAKRCGGGSELVRFGGNLAAMQSSILSFFGKVPETKGRGRSSSGLHRQKQPLSDFDDSKKRKRVVQESSSSCSSSEGSEYELVTVRPRVGPSRRVAVNPKRISARTSLQTSVPAASSPDQPPGVAPHPYPPIASSSSGLDSSTSADPDLEDAMPMLAESSSAQRSTQPPPPPPPADVLRPPRALRSRLPPPLKLPKAPNRTLQPPLASKPHPPSRKAAVGPQALLRRREIAPSCAADFSAFVLKYFCKAPPIHLILFAADFKFVRQSAPDGIGSRVVPYTLTAAPASGFVAHGGSQGVVTVFKFRDFAAPGAAEEDDFGASPVEVFVAHSRWISSLRFTGDILATTSDDGSIALWRPDRLICTTHHDPFSTPPLPY